MNLESIKIYSYLYVSGSQFTLMKYLNEKYSIIPQNKIKKTKLNFNKSLYEN